MSIAESWSDRDRLQVFADEDAAEAWFRENDPEGVAFEYPVKGIGAVRAGRLGWVLRSQPLWRQPRKVWR
jgi:hypothetical protein